MPRNGISQRLNKPSRISRKPKLLPFPAQSMCSLDWVTSLDAQGKWRSAKRRADL